MKNLDSCVRSQTINMNFRYKREEYMGQCSHDGGGEVCAEVAVRADGQFAGRHVQGTGRTEGLSVQSPRQQRADTGAGERGRRGAKTTRGRGHQATETT